MPTPMPMWMHHGARARAPQLRDAKGRASASKGEIGRSRSARVGRSVRLGHPRPVRRPSLRLLRPNEHARGVHAWVRNARPEAEKRASPNLRTRTCPLRLCHASTRTLAPARSHVRAQVRTGAGAAGHSVRCELRQEPALTATHGHSRPLTRTSSWSTPRSRALAVLLAPEMGQRGSDSAWR